MEILIRHWRREDLPAVRMILWESWIAAYSAFIPEEDLRTYFEATYQIDSLFVREEPFRMGRTTVPHMIGWKAI
jgi:hypothetical protein